MICTESVEHGIVSVTFQRPERRNALSIEMMRSLVQQMEDLAADGSTRVAILQGAGPIFCAGLDLAEASDRDLVQPSAECVAQVLHTLRYTTLVTIAAVHGGAYAGGAGLIAACDMAVGASDLQIGFPEARRGLLPALICDVLKTKVREGDLSELFLVGNTISAQRAQQIGLLQRVVEPNQVLREAIAMAQGVLAGGPKTIIDTKSLLHHAFDPNIQNPNDTSTSNSIEEHLKARFSEEASEGLLAFLEKRLPNWMTPPSSK
jgi:methylglutaconyl-CoA hydratase